MHYCWLLVCRQPLIVSLYVLTLYTLPSGLHLTLRIASFLQPAVAGSMVGVRLGLSEHIEENKKIFTLALDDEDRGRIDSVLRRSKDLMKVIGDCGAEYRRA